MSGTDLFANHVHLYKGFSVCPLKLYELIVGSTCIFFCVFKLFFKIEVIESDIFPLYL